ncbi:zinc metallopeptidase [Reichenbachiella agarivorans]|uniref:Zinc metallopeptidase n=1 Tax=Reichenbachiella agarivorans TaxID=2979464 RepID=A0ABY6CRH5_9BACT|nr:zinc metallopeptidase [Reichenbachiella agarivorans]UXP33114.1 zinc metallopeptidase [Reichenbachiella agarivorans]
MIVILIVFMIVGFFVSSRLKSKFKKYSQVGLKSGLSGREIAELMLRDNGIYDVKVMSVEGQLTDHYNPGNKTVNLSPEVYGGRSAAAAAVASHECGHAVQHATAYSFLEFRSAMVPIQNLSAKVLNFLMIGMFLFGSMVYSMGLDTIFLVVVIAQGVITLFALVTLPVEFDASKRALAWIDERGIVTKEEHVMAKDALHWAAMTYVVAAISAITQLLYFVMMFMGANRD